MLILRFAVFTPLKRCFDYLAPATMTEAILHTKIGARFLLPFGSRTIMGILLSIDTETEIATHKMKGAGECLDFTPVLTPALLELGQWMSAYYHAPLGEVLWMMLPPPLRSSHKIVPQAITFELTELGQIETMRLKKNAKNKIALAEFFLNHPVVFPADLAHLDFNYHSTLKQFIADEWVVKKLKDHTVLPANFHSVAANPLLNSAQANVIQTVLSQPPGFCVNLLEGVTGSGKTEVYLEITKSLLSQGKQVLILVPEIGLTPQFLARTQKQLNVTVLGIHSQLSPAKRFEIWQAASLNQVQLIIGTRTALFTPMPYLGMIIIDEEHDASYRSRDGIRYSARDSAIVYAKHLNIPIILGSATPSLESLYNTQKGRFVPLFLSQRAIGSIPEWQLIDNTENPQVDGLTEPLIRAIENKLQLNEQVILFLNRRGFSPVLFCQNCRWMADCPACDAHLTLHQHTLNCHHCGYKIHKPKHCPECHQDTLIPLGQGTQRIENALEAIFPSEKIIRMDRDVINNRQALENALSHINNNTACIILGTQMIAKGHDFPNVTLVGIIDTDNLLFSHDYHGEEQLAQLLMQVAGRGGRASKPATVLIQTYHPDHTIFTQLPKIGYHDYSMQLLEKRAAFNLPPFSYQAHILADSKVKDLAFNFLHQVAQCFDKDHAELAALVKISPAMNCTMPRRKGYFRAYLLLQTHQRKLLNQILLIFDTLLLKQKTRDLKFYMEIDPPESA